MSYWPFGPLAGYQYGNGMVRGTAYDSRMQPIEISDTQAGLGAIAAIAACQGGTTYTNQTAFLLDLQMFWGQSATQTTANNGVLWGILERNCGGTSPNKYATGYNYWQSFNYDALNRLTVANDNGGGGSGAGWNRNYNFDTWGNMWVTNATGIALAGPTATANVYYAANNQDSRWSYDAAGNMKSANGNSLSYNAENELTAAQGTYAYEGLSYDGLGRRVQKSISGGATTVYVYDVNGLASEYVNGAWAKDYVADGAGDLVATENAAGGVCTMCYYSTDHLGSVRMVTDQNGQVQGRHDYLPFGEEVGANQANRTSQWGPVSDVTEKFTGQVRDSESGMDYFNARYFMAPLGRFNSVDPGNAGASLGSSQSWNGYGYVMGNPLLFRDPSGLSSCTSTNNYCGAGVHAGGITHPPYGSFGVLHDGWNSIYDDLALTSLSSSSLLQSNAGSTQSGTAVVNYGGEAGGSDSFDWSSITDTSSSYWASLNTPTYIAAPDSMHTATMIRDYVQLSITFGPSVGPFNLCSVGPSITVSRTGSWFVGPTGGCGPSAGVPLGPVVAMNASIVAGWLNQSTPPSNDELINWLDGFSVGGSAGFGIGAGFQLSNGNSGWERSTEVGFYTPQAGLNAGWNFCVSACQP